MADPTRAELLAITSGLRVASRKEQVLVHKIKGIYKDEEVYEFYNGDKPVKTIFTYNKAKAFAEGVKFGRNIEMKCACGEPILTDGVCYDCAKVCSRCGEPSASGTCKDCVS